MTREDQHIKIELHLHDSVFKNYFEEFNSLL